MTLYLLDANVLIRAHEDYYPVDRIQPFWVWLLEMAEASVIKMPRVMKSRRLQVRSPIGLRGAT